MTGNFHVRAAACSLMLIAAIGTMTALRLQAQYSYLPTPSTVDGRFISITGGSIQTLGENPLVFKLASPSGASSIEIGIFDGDTYGTFDQGTVPLIFTLYADPEGDGSGTQVLNEWSGSSMTDRSWYTITQSNSPLARCSGGSYFYLLKVRTSDPATFHWSSFKLRTNGTISIARASNFTFSAPLASLADAQVIYPSYPALTPATYDGTWHFHMDVPTSVASLEVWDGDFDRGSYDCSDNDTDDEDTPSTIPLWASGSAVAEGVPAGTVPCQDASGIPTGGMATGAPPDDSRTAAFARPPGISYRVVAPDGAQYSNGNPSGNLEWEQFRLSTDAFDRSMMDYHADSLPSGSYDIVVSGLDLANLNAMRFPYDVAGVNASGVVVTPLRPDYTNGSIAGSVYLELGSNCSRGTLEPGLPLVTVRLAADYNGDGVTDQAMRTTTGLTGGFSFSGLHPGVYTITIDILTLQPDILVVCDSDGTATPHTVSLTLTMCSRSANILFGYGLGGDGLLSDISR